jgi:glycerol kinase
MIWERATGRPLGPAVSWQCQRGAPFCEALRARPGLGETVHCKTGLTLDAMFSGSKLRWLLDQIPDGALRAARGELCLGTMDAWALWNLTGGRVHACDMTNASRTLLFNLRTHDWTTSCSTLSARARAARSEASSALYGATRRWARSTARPIACLFGVSTARCSATPASSRAPSRHLRQGCVADERYARYRPLREGYLDTIAWVSRPRRAARDFWLEGNIYVTGAACKAG